MASLLNSHLHLSLIFPLLRCLRSMNIKICHSLVSCSPTLNAVSHLSPPRRFLSACFRASTGCRTNVENPNSNFRSISSSRIFMQRRKFNSPRTFYTNSYFITSRMVDGHGRLFGLISRPSLIPSVFGNVALPLNAELG